MNKRRVLIFLLLVVVSSSSLGDQPRQSTRQIWVENENVYVLHKHDVKAWTVNESEIRIINKETGEVVFSAGTTPFTMLVAVEGGKFFAGLSDLQAGSMPYGYNFALFTPEGKFISKVYVSQQSGYCEKVLQTVSQSVEWFRITGPEINLERIDGEISGIVVSPYYYGTKPCELPVGEHLLELNNEADNS